jgi:hypothetical protein
MMVSKGLQEATAIRAGHDYVHRRLVSQRDQLGAGPTEVWDSRPHAGKGGKGTMTQAVWKLKVVWDHAGTGTVRSRTIHQQIERAEKRLSKLNTVEATRLAGENTALKKAMCTCSGGGEMTRGSGSGH